jgi:hypothetical protein
MQRHNTLPNWSTRSIWASQDVVGDRRQQDRPHRRVEHLTLLFLTGGRIVVGALRLMTPL